MRTEQRQGCTGSRSRSARSSARPVQRISAVRRKRPPLTFACVNANGGINGRPIHYSIEDDQWNPETAAQVAAKLVNDTKVVGMVGNSSFVECAANAKFYETSNVLVIAGVGVPRDCFHAKNISPTNGGPRMSNIGAAQYMHDDLNVKRLVCLSLNIPNVGDWSCDGIAAYGKSGWHGSKNHSI